MEIGFVGLGRMGGNIRSRRESSFTDRLLAALRHAFGGHAVHR
jgi:6-phosphogluconate dehydrogenase (decarboxylating)